MDRLAVSFQQNLTVEGILTMVVNIAIILAIIHYLIIPITREIRADLGSEKSSVPSALSSQGGP